MDDDSVNNTLYDIQAVEKEEIPAEAFEEAPVSLTLLMLLATLADAAVAGVAAGCSAVTVEAGVGAGAGAGTGGEVDAEVVCGPAEDTKALEDENWMPP